MTGNNNKLRVHVISETPFLMKGQGVHTAFVDHVDLLKSKDDIHVFVNGEGMGDVFHSHTYGPYYFWKGFRYKKRRIYTVHVIPDSIKGSLPAWKFFMPFVRWYLRRVYNYADVCIAISPMVEEAIKSLKAKTKVVKIFNPLHTDKFAPRPELRSAARKLLDIPKNAFVVLGVGQIEPRKGVETFLEAALACPELNFVWVGGRPFGIMTEGIHKLNQLIAQSSGNVKFPGLFELDKMPLIYNAADLFLFPSHQENCPLAPLEAAAAELPVIFRDIQEYTKLYENPYMKAGNTQEFISLIKKLSADKNYYDESKLISKQLLTQFDKSRIREKLLSLYNDVYKSYTQSNNKS